MRCRFLVGAIAAAGLLGGSVEVLEQRHTAAADRTRGLGGDQDHCDPLAERIRVVTQSVSFEVHE